MERKEDELAALSERLDRREEKHKAEAQSLAARQADLQHKEEVMIYVPLFCGGLLRNFLHYF